MRRLRTFAEIGFAAAFLFLAAARAGSKPIPPGHPLYVEHLFLVQPGSLAPEAASLTVRAARLARGPAAQGTVG